MFHLSQRNRIICGNKKHENDVSNLKVTAQKLFRDVIMIVLTSKQRLSVFKCLDTLYNYVVIRCRVLFAPSSKSPDIIP